ncbi:hypothetical protein [Desulfurivibrio dismutans]|uniref:hypothetical protein n=1 Tax=Desulfurivibrio dismutans TaxID=1398908 RepID=UPI0023DCE1C1|nr:hypothetical protein [Desulfurivibrio alkaliphilus]MDF1615445.1 hypothetical protein [Desulfurivibrio alkaliphilus]
MGNHQGGVLLGLVAAMVMAGVLGAAAASMLGTSSLHGVRANYGERAYYLAESGFRYAASTLRSDADEFWELDGEEFIVAGGTFTLELAKLTEEEGYDAEAWVAGTQTVSNAPGERDLQIESGAQLAPRNGLFRYQGSWYRYREFSDDTLVAVIAAIPNRREVQGAQAINEEDDLPLKAGSVIPASDHVFLHNGVEYGYEEFAGGALRNISGDSDDFPLTLDDGEFLHFPALFPFTVQDQDVLEFAPVIQVRSIGEYPGDNSSLNVSRAVTYWFYDDAGFPLEISGDDEFVGDGEMIASDMDNFGEGPGASGKGAPLGKFGTVDEDGAPAIQLQGMNPGGQHPMTSLLYSGQVGPDYEVQVKVKIEQDLDPMAYMAGITFRLQGDGNTPGQLGKGLYGVSFVKGHPEASGNDAPSPEILAEIGKEEPHLVLWKTVGSGANFGAQPLAWHSLANSSIVNEEGRLLDWSTLLLRVQQLGESGGNRIQVLYGDHVVESISGDSDPYNDDIRITSPRGGLDNDGSQVLPWPPSDFGDWTEAVDYFTVTSIDVTDDSNDYKSDAAAEVGLHTWGHNLVECTGQGNSEVCDGKVFFDNFAVREAGQGDGGGAGYGGGYIPPIQQ